MTREKAIKHLMNDWFMSLGGQLCVDGDKKDAFTEAIGVAVVALMEKPVVKCKDCMYSRPIDREDSYEAFFDEDFVWCTIRDTGEYSMGFCYSAARRDDAENH